MLEDSYSRKFKYLRLSLTEKCNFKCQYCLPDGYNGCGSKNLTLDEIRHLAFAFKDLGIEKIRLTGGEPTLRPDLTEIIQMLKDDVGIQHIALTTNGFRLEHDLENLKKAGLDFINISLDSLNRDKFKSICGIDKFDSVKNSIDCALHLNFKKIKLNCVLLKGINEGEFDDFLEFVKSRSIAFRFIELMRTTDNKSYFEQHHLSVSSFQHLLLHSGWTPKIPSATDGPAKEFSNPLFLGNIGFISPYSKDFCMTCNRLRISSTGSLRLCLFGQGDISLRHLLQSAEDRWHLKEFIFHTLKLKPEGHRLHESIVGNMNSLSAIGG